MVIIVMNIRVKLINKLLLIIITLSKHLFIISNILHYFKFYLNLIKFKIKVHILVFV